MKEANFYRKTLSKIVLSLDFEALDDFLDPYVWELLDIAEREQLALLLVKWGKKLLKKKEEKALAVLEHASILAPECFEVQSSLGISWYTYAKQYLNGRSFKHAESFFQKALELKSNSFDMWYYWGKALIYLGIIQQGASFFQEADEKFSRAFTCLLKSKKKRAKLFWHWGRCWYFWGKTSGEAHDFRKAITKYDEAMKAGCDKAYFWNDYANTLVEMGCLIYKPEFFIQALGYYQKSTEVSSRCFEGCLNGGCTAQRLFYLTADVDYLLQAHHFFGKGAEIRKNNVNLWFKWGELFLAVGKFKKSNRWIKESITKFEIANACEEDNPLVLNCWAEALILLAGTKEDLEMLHDAEAKVIHSLEVAPENPETWYVYGICLNELGKYFADDDYFSDAVEKFQYGMTLNQSHPLLWYGLALSHLYLSERQDDFFMLEKSLTCFEKVMELGPTFPQFWTNWGITLMKMGECANEKHYFESAVEKFEKNLKIPEVRQSDTECLYHYGCALDILGDFHDDDSYYRKSILILSQALEIDPTQMSVRYNLAISLSHYAECTGDSESFEHAFRNFQIIIEADVEDEIAWSDWGMALLSYAYLINDKIDPDRHSQLCRDAETKLINAAGLGNTQAYYPLACLYSITNRYDTAILFLERAEDAGTLPSTRDIMEDEWLEGLIKTEPFRNFLTYRVNKNTDDPEW